ncbi:chemotaxis protein [Sphingomonas changnyeongensis]|uniref:Chemotaxis protein methyltransferase n=1 Tax=Sphingomonas changnyeongensis TaxID=2698679 RepID=A0A7Z2S7I0_9SPHN|nr:protein-glutamate O-methyltransferase CheR [Sphingomonas changnyeongensis]QHL89637.1 chemotaxis protein [Sphingomonas changnyeongensis]
MGHPQVSDDDFERFRDYFHRETGIHFDASKRYFVDKRLVERVRETSSGSAKAYLARLSQGGAATELQQLINAMTVNETYFLREEYQFEALVDSVLPDIVARRRHRRPIRIWCVPSSTGEEPYSVAIYLLERWPALADWDVEILSSDIDTAVLERARAGRYSARSVQHLPRAWLARYFVPRGDEYQLSSEIRDSVSFTRCNLTAPGETRAFRDIDVIFCRNLLIYFDDRSRRIAADALYDALTPGGFVLLGHSESMGRISSLFSPRRLPRAIVHQRPGDAA